MDTEALEAIRRRIGENGWRFALAQRREMQKSNTRPAEVGRLWRELLEILDRGRTP